MGRRRKQSDGGEQNADVNAVKASEVPVVTLTKGATALPDEREEEFCQRFAKGENPYDVYHQVYPTVAERNVVGAATRKMARCKDRIDYLVSKLNEEEKRWTTWTKEESTKELKHIVKDPDTTNSIRIKAITELNTMYQHNNPRAAGLTIENKGIVFMARDGITLSNDFLRQAKEAIAKENNKFIDVTPDKKEGDDGNSKA